MNIIVGYKVENLELIGEVVYFVEEVDSYSFLREAVLIVVIGDSSFIMIKVDNKFIIERDN